MPRSKTPWENEFWNPQPMLSDGKVVFILGGGPSLDKADLGLLDTYNTISVNSSAYVAREVGLDTGILWFTDNGWWHTHEPLVRSWRGMVCTVSRAAKREARDIIRRVEVCSPTPEFPMLSAPCIRWGRSSGHTAISLAVAMGASDIVLLGYDMRLVGGLSHHHDDYNGIAHPGVYEEFIDHFAGWNDAALNCDVNIWNATPESALKEFRMVNLKQMFNGKSGARLTREDILAAHFITTAAEEKIEPIPVEEVHSDFIGKKDFPTEIKRSLPRVFRRSIT